MRSKQPALAMNSNTLVKGMASVGFMEGVRSVSTTGLKLEKDSAIGVLRLMGGAEVRRCHAAKAGALMTSR